MVIINATSSVLNGIGPFTFTFSVFNGCADIKFTDSEGNTGVNSIVVTSINPVVQVKAEHVQDDCDSDILGTISISVEDTNNCLSTVSEEVANPCAALDGSISSVPFGSGNMLHTVSLEGGNSPFSFLWELIVDDGGGMPYQEPVAISPLDGQQLTVDRNGDDAYGVQVTVIDANGCQKVISTSIPQAGTAPVISNFSHQINCLDSLLPVVLDILILANDWNGSIDLNSIETPTLPTKGTLEVDNVSGEIKYTKNSGATGIDTFSYTVKDNQGNTSNTGIATIQITPCLQAPIASSDFVQITCNEVRIIDVLANDNDIDGVINSSTLEIVSDPLHGTAIILPNGTIQYTPDNNFQGDDRIRYVVMDNDGLLSNPSVGRLDITVFPCCDNHSIGMAINCLSGNPIQFQAVDTGDVGIGVTNDIIEVNEGSGYVIGDIGNLNVLCSEVDTLAGKPASLGGGATLQWTNTGSSTYYFDYNFNTPISPDLANLWSNFIQNASPNEVVEMIGDGLPGTIPDRYIRGNMSAISFSTTFFRFTYVVNTNDSICGTEINTFVTDSHLLMGNAPQTVSNLSLSNISKRTFGTITNTLTFKRTVVRTGCDDVVVEQEVLVNDINNACGSFTVNLLQAGGGTGAQNLNQDVEMIHAFSGIISIDSVIANGVNVLSQPYDFPAEIQSIEDEIDAWLLDNGGGQSNVYAADNRTVIIQVIGTTAYFSVAQIGLFNGNTQVGNFTTINP